MIPPVPGIGRIMMTPAPAPSYVDMLEKKISAARRLTDSLCILFSHREDDEQAKRTNAVSDALFEWMTIETKSQLDSIRSLPVPSPVDTLIALQTELDEIRNRKDEMEKVLTVISGKTGLEELSEMLRVLFLAPIDHQIESMTRQISEVQRQAENDTAGKSDGDNAAA